MTESSQSSIFRGAIGDVTLDADTVVQIPGRRAPRNPNELGEGFEEPCH